MIERLPRHGLARLAVGVAISAVLLGVTLARVDLPRTAQAIAQAAPLGLTVAVGIVLLDLALRALRWRVLVAGAIAPSPAPPFRLALGYLSIGYAANAVLPARLGDVARAVLAGTAFGMPRLAVFGTILVERLTDGLTMLALAIASTLVVARIAALEQLAVLGLVAGIAAVVAAGIAWLVLSRASARRPVLARIAALVERVGAGARALRSAMAATLYLALTAAVTSTAILGAWTVAQSVGVSLTPLQAVLFMSGVALSLAIPAAPGSLGTYEFAGVTIISGLGFPPEQGLATMILMRVVTSFLPSVAGVISLLALQIRPRTLVAPPG